MVRRLQVKTPLPNSIRTPLLAGKSRVLLEFLFAGWYITDTLLVRYWYVTCMLLVYYWYVTGMLLVHYWYVTGMLLVRFWYDY